VSFSTTGPSGKAGVPYKREGSAAFTPLQGSFAKYRSEINWLAGVEAGWLIARCFVEETIAVSLE